MIKEIRLYGHLANRFGRSFKYDITTPAEAIAALRATVPGFANYMIQHSAPGYRILIGKEVVPTVKDLNYGTSAKVIKIVPVMAGAAGKGVFGIILGIALIVVTGGFGAALAIPALAGTTLGSMAMSIGISMVVGGVSSMLSSSPKPATASVKAANLPSESFSGAINNAVQGGAVPLCYGGPMIVGSVVASAGMSADEAPIVGAAPDEPDPPVEYTETYTIDDESPYAQTVVHGDLYLSTVSVTLDDGDIVLTQVPADPTGAEYTVTTAGRYTFHYSLSGSSVTIVYMAGEGGGGSVSGGGSGDGGDGDGGDA